MSNLIQELDNLRYEEPLRALEKARAELLSSSPVLKAQLLGVSASCYRLLADIPRAKGCIARGLDIADRKRALSTKGDLLQRLSLLTRDEGRIHLSLDINMEAILTNVDEEWRVGRCFVDRGTFLFSLGRLKEAEYFFLRSTGFLAPDDMRNKFSAYQNLATCLVEQGALNDAKIYALKAKDFSRAAGAYFKAHLEWLLADISRAELDFDLAIEHYSNAFADFFRLSQGGLRATVAAGQAAVVGFDLLRVTIRAGDKRKSSEVVEKLVSLALPLNTNSCVARVLLDLRHMHILDEKCVVKMAERVQKGLNMPARNPMNKGRYSPQPANISIDFSLAERLDELRYSQPLLALAEARVFALRAEPPLKGRLLGVAASCHRLLSEIALGKGCILEGLKSSQNTRDFSLRGDLMQRLSLLVRDEGDVALSLNLNGLAILDHLGNRGRVGRCLVDRGTFFFALGKTEEAISVLKESIQLLSPADRRNLFSANQNLATALATQGSLAEAITYAKNALELEDAAGDYSRAYLQWLLGDLIDLMGNPSEALKYYALAMEIFLELAFCINQASVAAGQAAVVGLKVAERQFAAGDVEEACKTARSLARLAVPLSNNPVVYDALLNLGRVGQLSEASLTEASARVKRGLGVETQTRRHFSVPDYVMLPPLGSDIGP